MSVSIQKSAWRDISIEKLLKELRPLLYTTDTREGILPYFFMLKAWAQCQIFVIAKNKEKVYKILNTLYTQYDVH